MLLILFLILILLFGFEITLLIRNDSEYIERITLSYLLGLGVFSLFIFIFDLIFSINYSAYNTFSVLVLLNLVLIKFKIKETISFLNTIKIDKNKIRIKVILFWGLIFSVFVYTLLVNTFWPITDWDALALYDFRAQVLLIDKNLIQTAISNNYFLGYPLLTSLSHLFMYQIGLSNPKFIYSLYYLSLVIIFYSSLKKHISSNKAMLFAMVLLLTPEIFSQSVVAYTNLPYLTYFCCGVFYLYEWIRNKKLSYLLLSGLLVGLSNWVRFAEPFWLIPLMIVFVISVRQKKLANGFYYLIFILTPWVSWQSFTIYISSFVSNKLGESVSTRSSLKDVFSYNNILMIVDYLYKNVFLTWGLLSVLFILAILKFCLGKSKDKFVLYITLLFFVLLFVGTFAFTYFYPDWYGIPDSARRMSMFLLPLMLYLIALAFD